MFFQFSIAYLPKKYFSIRKLQVSFTEKVFFLLESFSSFNFNLGFLDTSISILLLFTVKIMYSANITPQTVHSEHPILKSNIFWLYF